MIAHLSLAIVAAGASPLIAAALLVGLLRVLRQRRARLDREAADALTRAFAERGGARILHAGYNPAQQSAAIRRAQQHWRRRFSRPSGRARAGRTDNLVDIRSRKASR